PSAVAVPTTFDAPATGRQLGWVSPATDWLTTLRSPVVTSTIRMPVLDPYATYPPSGDHTGLRAMSPASVSVVTPPVAAPSRGMAASRRERLVQLPVSWITPHWTNTIRSPSGL